MNLLDDIPFLGSGLGYRRQLREEIIGARDSIDFLEIITDQFIENPHWIADLENICEIFCVIPHGIGLSLGSIAPADSEYLHAIKQISDLTQAPYYSEHLCITRVPGIDIGHLAPLWFTEEVLENTITKVIAVQDFLGKPLILENVTYLIDIPNGSLIQTDFFYELVEATGCGVLLDITNVYINSVNHGFESAKFLEQMPLKSVVQVHIAGGFWNQGILIDGHSELVQEDSWQLLRSLAERTEIKGIILEHDSHFPEFRILLDQISRARDIIQISQKWPADPGLHE